MRGRSCARSSEPLDHLGLREPCSATPSTRASGSPRSASGSARLIHADARDPDSLRVAGPGRPHPAGGGRAARLPRRRAGRAVRAAVGDLLVPGRGDRPGGVGRRAGRPALGEPQRGDALDRRPPGAGPELEPGRRPDRRARARAGGRRRAARPARRAGLQRQVRRASAARTRRSSRSCSTAAGSPASTAGPGTCTTTSTSCAGSRPTPPTGSTSRGPGELLSELNRFCNVWVEDDRSTWDEAEAILTALLAHRNGSHVHELSAIGHAHIDTAWLWPLAETQRKMVRTFSSQTAYMDRYPEFRFACSQAQQYDWIRTRNPDLYERILAACRGRAGGCRSAARGSSPTATCPSGESLVRQFLHGQRFFEREFGRRCREFWNPDVFGYNGQLPADHARRRHRPLPHPEALVEPLQPARRTTRSRGRGSTAREVLAHFPPADTYNATAEVEELRRSARDYKDHDRSRRSLLVFGYGDGGGGPTPEMLETLRRVARPAGRAAHDDRHVATSSSTRSRPDAADAARRSSASSTSSTTAARTRPRRRSSAGNREGERALHDAELLAALATRVAGAELSERAAGRAVAAAAAEPVPRHPARVEHRARSTRTPPATTPRCWPAPRRSRPTRWRRSPASGGGPTPVNTHRRSARAEVAARPDGELVVGRGAAVRLRRGRRRRPDAVSVAETGDGVVLENGLLRAELGRDGLLRSLVAAGDRARGARRAGQRAPALRRPPDRRSTPGTSTRSTSRRSRDCPPGDVVRGDGAGGRCAPRWRSSGRSGAASTHAPGRAPGRGRAAARVPLRGRLARVAHDAEGAVPGRACAARTRPTRCSSAHAERPTHYSTQPRPGPLRGARAPLRRPVRARLRRRAPDRLQVRLLDLRRTRCGSACCARRPSPIPQADIGRHEFAYAVMPHAGGWREAGRGGRGGAVRDAAPLGARRAPSRARGSSVDDPNLVLDTVKRAEDSDALVAAALRGARRAAARRGCASACRSPSAVSCNLLEDAGRAARDGRRRDRPRLPAARDRERAGQVNHRGQVPHGVRGANRRAALRVEEVEPVEVDRQPRRVALLDTRRRAPGGRSARRRARRRPGTPSAPSPATRSGSP